MIKLKTSVATVAVALFVAACGGGGGNDAAVAPPVAVTPPVVSPPQPVVTPADIQTTVPALTYATTSEEFMFVSALNKFRADTGLGLLAQSAMLDSAAVKHLDYVLKNDVLNGGTVNMRANDPVTGRSMFHIEQADKPLFSGIEELDRAKAVGYRGTYVGEELTFGGGKGAQVALSGIISTVYHRAGLMMQGVNDIGVAVGQDRSQTVVMEMGVTKAQSQASDFVGVYPAANQTAVGVNAGVETPNPFPELSTANDDFPTKTGYPVSVVVKEGMTVEVLTFTITEAGAVAPLDARILTKDNDPNRYLSSNIAFLVAKAPLKASTVYTVKFSGRANNVVVNREWKFTTRS
jgi:uncharacterized protein YkwD